MTSLCLRMRHKAALAGDGDASSFVMSCVKLARRLKIKMADGSDECLSYWLWESEMKGRRNQDITKKDRVEL